MESLEVRQVLSASGVILETVPVAPQQVEVANAVPGELLIHFRDAADFNDLRGVYQAHGLQEIERLYNADDVPGIRRVSVPAVALDAVTRALQKNPHVQFVEPNFVASSFAVNDSFYRYQWGLNNSTNGGINVEQAWQISTGANAIVAVLDSGIAYKNHQDATGVYYQAPDLASTRFVSGYDFINNDPHANDDNSHGTHVAGTIAQSTNNARGTAGVAYDATLMPVKVLGKDGNGSYSAIASGIRWAADQGAHIINMSLGGSTASRTLEDAVAYAFSRGVTIIAAAGNNGTNAVSYPAAYDDYVIAVSATRFDETLAGYSNYGSSIDLAAPGGDTSVDQNGDGYNDGILQNTFNPSTKDTSAFGYYFFQGTSMAAPHVAGVAAMIVSQGITDPTEVRQILESTAKDRGPQGKDIYFGHGIVDAAAAMEAVRNRNTDPVDTNAAPVARDDTASTSQATPVTVAVLANDSDADGDPLSVQAVNVPANGTVMLNADQTITYTPNSDFSGIDSFTYTISDGRGGAATATVSITVSPATQDPGGAVRIVDLDGTATSVRNQWRAAVLITVGGSSGSDAAGLRVTGRWSDGRAFAGTTNAAGQVTATSGLISKKVDSISFLVENVDHPDYDPSLNSDPDGDSNGTNITIFKDGSTTFSSGSRGNQFVDSDRFVPASQRESLIDLKGQAAQDDLTGPDANITGNRGAGTGGPQQFINSPLRNPLSGRSLNASQPESESPASSPLASTLVEAVHDEALLAYLAELV